MATQPKIGVRITPTGVDDVKKRMEEIRVSGEASFKRLGDAGKQVGTQLEGTLAKAQKAAAALGSISRGSANAVQASVGALARSIDLVLGKVSSLASLAGLTGIGLAATFGGTYAGLRSVAISTGEVIEQQLKLSKSSGISIDLMTRWQSAARIAGGTGNGVAAGFKSVTEKIISAAQGSEDALKPFTQLDLKIRDGAGNLKDFEKITLEVIDKLAAIENPAIRAKAAVDLFGSGADDIVPLLSKGASGLQNYLKQADAFGTVLDKDAAQKVSDTLERKRRLDESLQGLKYAISVALLPIFTQSNERVANWMQKNSKAIRLLISDVGKAVEQFQKDMANVLKGNDSAIQNSLIRNLAPAIRGTGALLLDFGAAMAGRGFGTVLPWVAHAVQALKAFKGIVEAVYTRTQGFIEDIIGGPLPTKDTVFQTLTKAFKDVRSGILGLNVPINFPAMRNLGTGVASASEALVNFGAILVGFSPAVIQFAQVTLAYVSEGFKALRQSIQEGSIRPDNYFAFMNVLIPYLKAGWEEVQAIFGRALQRLGIDGGDWRDGFVLIFTTVFEKIREFYNGTGEAFTGVSGYLEQLGVKATKLAEFGDKVAQSLGLSNWKELGIVALLAHITGIDGLILKLIPAFTSLAGLAIQIILLFGTMVGWIFTFLTVVVGLGAGVAAALTIIPLALAALLFGLYYFQDTTVAILKAIGGFILDVIDFLSSVFVALFITPFVEGFKLVFEALGILARGAADVVRSVWSGIASFFEAIGSAIGGALSTAWEGIKSGANAAWEFTKGLWSGLYELFLTPIRRVQALFSDLWGGVRDGAANAWSAAKRFFGFGGQDQRQGGAGSEAAMPSFDVGGYVPGSPGAPLRALVHGGERILNLQETGLFERIMSGLSNLGGMDMLGDLAMPAMAPALAPAAVGGGMVSTPFDLNGRRISGFQGPPSAVRELRMAFAKDATRGGGRMPRWYGGY